MYIVLSFNLFFLCGYRNDYCVQFPFTKQAAYCYTMYCKTTEDLKRPPRPTACRLRTRQHRKAVVLDFCWLIVSAK